MISPGRRSPPRLVLPDELFVNVATSVGAEVNRALVFLQNVGSRGDIKQLATVCLNESSPFDLSVILLLCW